MRRLIAGGALLAAAAGAWWIVRADHPDAERAPDPMSMRVSQATIVLRHRGVKQAEIAADRVEVSADRRTTTFVGGARTVFFNGTAPAVTATGGRIVLDRATQSVRVEGGLRITTARGETLTAQAASWDRESGVIELVGYVTGAASPPPSPGPGGVTAGMGRLRADRIRHETRTQVTVASGNVVLLVGDAEIRADNLKIDAAAQVAIATGNVTVRQRDARLAAPALRYEFRTETAEASGGAVLEQQAATIRAPQMRFELRDEVTTAAGGVEVRQAESVLTAPSLRYEARSGDLTAEGGVSLAQPGSRLTGRRLLANLPARRADVRGDAVLVREPGPPPSPSDRAAAALAREETTVTAGRIVFRWDVTEAEAEDRVVVKQRDKTAWADRMTYSEPSNRLIMTGRVVLEQLSGEWLVREGLAAPPRDERDRAALASVTRLTSTRLTMTLRERDIVAEGPLTVTQKDRSASGDHGTYTAATRLLVVTGNVRLQEANGQRLRADRVVISLVDETFEAEGNVQTEFVIRPSPAGRSTPAIRPSPTPRP